MVKNYLVMFCLLLIGNSLVAQSSLCSSEGSDQSYEWVTRIKIADGEKTSGKVGYMDFTSSSIATLTAGETYPVEIDVNTDGTPYVEYVKLWLDANQDNVIQDPSELVYNQNHEVIGFKTFTGNITIPSTAFSGPMIIRMIMQYQAAPELCGTYTYGTTYDVKVNIIGGQTNPDYYNLSVSTTGEGEIVSNPEGITTAEGITSFDFPAGTNVTLTATPNPDTEFLNWTDDASGTNTSYSLIMDKDSNIIANFTTANPPPVISTGPSNKEICLGDSTTFSISATGATTYQWQISSDSGFVNLSNGGVYSGVTSNMLEITEATLAMNGRQFRCVATNTSGSTTSSNAVLTVTDITAGITSSNDTTCNGGNDGGATASASGGTAPYSYSWSNGATTASISKVTAGTYTVTVTDANGCTDTANITVTEPTALVASGTVDSNVSCNGGNDGSATASASGGTVPYSYSWSNAATTASISGVTAGTYTVTVTDANGCTDTANITVTEPTALVASGTVDSNVSCNGSADGAATVSASGGTAPYSYSWSNAATTASISGVTAGTYIVTVTDANGCTDTVNITVTEPTALVASGTVDSNVSCNGGNDGSATASASGGTAPYSYSWSNAATTASISGVTAGTYTVTVTDANGCTDTANVTLTEPTALVASGTVDSNVSCNGGNDGSATASASGGTAPYSYSWSNAATTASISGVTAGTYTVTVTDANGCTDTANVTLTEPTALVASGTVDSNVTCNGGNDGGATASASGGTAPYSYSWSNGAKTASVIGVTAGTYTVTVTDANGCTDTSNITMTEPTALVASGTVDSNVTCNGGNDGSATASASGGTAPYSYSWSNGATTASISKVIAGTYTVTVTDANGCTDTANITVTEPTALVASGTVNSNVRCNGGNDGSATASASGGTAPYSYSWSNGATTASISGVTAGTYTVTVTDANGCTANTSVTIEISDKSGPDITSKDFVLQLDENGQGVIDYKNVTETIQDDCNIAYIHVSNNHYSCENIGDNLVTITAVDVNGNESIATSTVTVKDNLTPSVVTRDITVQLDASGEFTIVPADIDDASTDNCAIDTYSLDIDSFTCTDVNSPVTVTLTVKDVNGNSASETATVTVEDNVAPVVATKNITVQLDENGVASIVPADINNGSTDNCAIDTYSLDIDSFTCADVNSPVTVTLTVKDMNGNSASETATVTVEDNFAPVVATKNITVELDANGEASIVPADINNGSTDNCAIDTYSLDIDSFNCADVGAPVTVTLTVKDVNGNSASETATVTVEDNIDPVVATKNITVELDVNGEASIVPADINNGSTDICAIDTYSLDIDSFSCADVNSPITVTLTVKDVNGNSASETATITVKIRLLQWLPQRTSLLN